MSTETKKPEAKKAAPQKAQSKQSSEIKTESKKVTETKKPEAKDFGIRPVRHAKIITTEEVMTKWADLVNILAWYLEQQRKAGKAWRHINQVHVVLKQHMLRFKRNLPE